MTPAQELLVRAIVLETQHPGAHVLLWKVAERLSLSGPKIGWPSLRKDVDELAELGIVSLTKARGGYQGVRYNGVIIFDPVGQSRVVPEHPNAIDRIDTVPDIVEVLNALGRYHLAVYTTANQERDTYSA